MRGRRIRLPIVLLLALAMASAHAAAGTPAALDSSNGARSSAAAAAAAAALRALIDALPKAELHLHIEGTLEVPLMMRLAQRNNIPLPYKDADEARAARASYASLAPFLEEYRVGMSTLRTRDDFRELGAAYLKRAAEQNVRRAEIFVDLQTHERNGVSREAVVGGLMEAVRAAARADHAPRPVDAALILCFVRDWGPLAAAKTAAAALPFFRRKELIGVGLASAEVGNPPGPFWPVFLAARAAGRHRTAHAGEEGGPEYVWGALNALRAERIDHGVRALEDPALIARLRETQTPLTVCPLSNLALKVYNGQLQERMRELFLESGVAVTVNSDDPAYFGAPGGGGGGGGESGYVNANYAYLADLVGLGPRDLLRLAQASLNASFWDEASKRRGCEEAEAAWRAWEAGPGGEAYKRAMAAANVGAGKNAADAVAVS